MSDLLAEYSPLTGLTPEEALQAQKDMYGRVLKGVNAAASMPATLVSPDLHLTDMTGGPEWLNHLPFAGAVEGAVGLGGAAINAGSALTNLALSRYGINIPKVPMGAAQHFEKTRGEIKDEIAAHSPFPAPDMSDEADKYTDLVGSLAGSVIPLAPGAAMTMLPRGTQSLAGFLLPATGHVGKNAAIVSGLGLAAGGGMAAQDALAKDKEEVPGFNAYLQQPDAATQAPPTAPPTAPAAPAAPAPDINTQLNQALSGEGVSVGPTFAEEGYSGHSVLDALFTIGGILTAIGAAKFTHGIRGAATDADRVARFTNPEYAQKSSDYNNAVIARGGDIAPTGLEPAVPPPLPEANKFRQATNAVNTQVLNENAQMQDAIRVISEPSVAERIAHQYGNVHTDAARQVRAENFFETGRDERTGMRIPSPADTFRDIAKLSDEEQVRLAKGLNSLNELDNRANNARIFRQQNPGKTPSPQDIRHDFADFDDQQLRTYVAMMTNDPRLAGIAGRFKGTTDGILDIGEKWGFFPSSEVADLKSSHPHYVPETGPGGEILHPFGARPTGVMSGVKNINTPPWYALAQHLDALHHQFELNDMNRTLWQTQMDAQRQFPGSAQFMREVKPTNPAYSFYGNELGTFRDPIVAIRTSSGPKYIQVDHPDFYNAMTGDSIRKRNIARDMLTVPRRLYQQGTTGVVSAATGRLYPPVNATFTSGLMATNAPRNMYGGLVDKGIQRLTGETSGVGRGVDLVSNLPYVGYSYLRGVADRRIGNIANMLRPDQIINHFGGPLSKLLGNATVQSMHKALEDYYLNSVTNRIRGMGIGGSGAPIKSDLPALAIEGSKQMRTVAAKMVPQLFFSGKWMGTKPFFLRLNRVIQEAMTNMGDAGHDAFARLNFNNPKVDKQTLAYETRQLTGDPGTHGASAWIKTISGALPYTNVGLQGIARFGRALGDGVAPVTLASGLGTLALASILTHMRSPAHMDYLQNELSEQQRAGNLVLATNDDPHKPTLIPLPQEFRAAYALALDLMSKAVNFLAARHDSGVRDNVMEAIKDFLGSHITNSSEGAMVHGAVDAGGVINLPPYAGQFDWNAVLHGKNIFDSYRSPIQRDVNLPNQPGDGLLADKDGKVWNSIFRGVFGMLGAAVGGGMDNVSRYAAQTGDWVKALGMGGHDWVQGFQDKNPQFNVLFENAVRLSTLPPIAEHMDRKLDALAKVTGSNTEERAEGRTGAGRYGQEVPVGETKKIPTEPTMRRMYQVADAYRSRMSGRLDEISNIKKQMGAVDQQGMDVIKRREWMNARTRDLADKYRVIGGYMADMEHMLSRVAGKPVHIEGIDWSKGPEQFHD